MASEAEKWKARYENERRARVEAEEFLSNRLRSLYLTKEQLEAANRELDAFAYSVSHDLRAPLRALNSFTSLLVENGAGAVDERGRHYLERIREASRRMVELIEGLNDLSRIARWEIRRQEVDLGAMALAIAAELREKAPRRQVEFVVAPDLRAMGDPRLLRLVLQNLLENAWKFTRHHPTERIEVGVADVEGGKAWFVRDDGAGFDMQYAGKLFAPFHRLHAEAEFEGTGIGLATVERIVRRHGGRVWAEAAIEKGATFYFTL